MTNRNALDIELLFDAEEIAAGIATANRLVAPDSFREVKDGVTHLRARTFVGDDYANGSLFVRDNADVGAGGSLAGDTRRNNVSEILDRHGRLHWDEPESKLIFVTHKIELT